MVSLHEPGSNPDPEAYYIVPGHVFEINELLR
jgi:hypothetical protein